MTLFRTVEVAVVAEPVTPLVLEQTARLERLAVPEALVKPVVAAAGGAGGNGRAASPGGDAGDGRAATNCGGPGGGRRRWRRS